jgi:hypothetical protein
MSRSRHFQSTARLLLLTLAAQGCAHEFKEDEANAKSMPVNCATADGDLRMLRNEKAHVVEQIAMGATAIYPASAVVGVLTGVEGTKLQVASGEYNQTLDAKIAEIQRVCGVQ